MELLDANSLIDWKSFRGRGLTPVYSASFALVSSGINGEEHRLTKASKPPIVAKGSVVCSSSSMLLMQWSADFPWRGPVMMNEYESRYLAAKALNWSRRSLSRGPMWARKTILSTSRRVDTSVASTSITGVRRALLRNASISLDVLSPRCRCIPPSRRYRRMAGYEAMSNSWHIIIFAEQSKLTMSGSLDVSCSAFHSGSRALPASLSGWVMVCSVLLIEVRDVCIQEQLCSVSVLGIRRPFSN